MWTRQILKRTPRVHGRTIVSLTFDDGTADHAAAAQLLAERGLAGTFYVNSNRIGSDPTYLDWPQLATMAAAGHEIGGHTADHLDLTAVDEDAARTQIASDRSTLLAHGLDVRAFAYPYGSSDHRVRGLVAAAGYATGRRAWGLAGSVGDTARPIVERLPPADPYAVRTIPSIENGTTVRELQDLVARSARARGWIPLVFHRVSGGEGRYAISEDVFREFVDWLAEFQGRVEVRTVRATAHAR